MANPNVAGVQNIQSVFKNLDEVKAIGIERVANAMKAAGLIVAEKMAETAPRGRTNLVKRSFTARDSKKLRKKLGQRVVVVGMLRLTYYRTLKKGRKPFKKTSSKGLVFKVSGSPASHPHWSPADRVRYSEMFMAQTKAILRSKGRLSFGDRLIQGTRR